MKIRLLLALMLLPFCVQAQERVTVRGRVVNPQGEAVEYVQIGVPERHIGTISSADGQFEISVPCDTLEFFHVSYRTARLAVTGPVDDVVIVLQENELAPAVFIGGNTKEKYLVHPGMKVHENLGRASFYYPGGGGKGCELGCIARAKKPFLIRNIQFTILGNYIPGCVVSINIYRIEGDPETFVNVLHKPIYVHIAQSGTRQEFDIRPEESILLEPGKYFVAIQIVGVDEDAARKILETPESERDPDALHMYTAIYFKTSYERYSTLGEIIRIPVNIGISVKGLEYQ